MYLNILKKDLKRKKTMNIILLIFIILAVMFVSSSGNNFTSIFTALDSYMDSAGVPDYFIGTKGTAPNGKSVTDIVKKLDYVTSCKTENCIYTSLDAIKVNNKKIDMQYMGQETLTSFKSSVLTYFDGNNEKITNIDKGELYLKKTFLTENNISIGDKITITIDNVSDEFTIKGYIKNAVFGSSMMDNQNFVLNQADYEKFLKLNSLESRKGQYIYIDTTNTASLKQEISDDPTIVFAGDRNLIKTTYIMDMIIAGILLVMSIFLIIIAFVILKFTITFTLKEEFREIGIMKAIGIKNIKIRSLYIVKYFAMSVTGAVIGFICGIPFGNMLLMQASDNIVLNSKSGVLINLICSIAVVLIIMLFCYRSTKKVKHFTPVDAIRNGQTGERFRRKGIIKLSKIHLRPVTFMAINDIFSGFKQFSIVMLSFMIGILLITITLNTISTLQSDKLISWFSMTESDVYLVFKNSEEKYIVNDGHQKLKEDLKEMENELSDNGIKAKCASEILFKFTIEKGDYKCKSLSFQGTGTTADQYTYLEGTAPVNKNEVAITYIIADTIHAKIGDTVTISTAEGSSDYIVTAIYQSMNNMGEGIRINEKVELDYSQAFEIFDYQITYTDNPTDNEKNERLKLIKELYPNYSVKNGGEYVDTLIGGAAGYMNDVAYLIVLIVIIINILVSVLMEKSFFTNEKSEIAMLKAIGFSNRAIICRQTLRMAIVMTAAAIIAVLLAEPVGQLAVTGIFRIMGAKNIIFDVNIIQTYIIYPLIVLVCTIISVFIASQQVRKVSSSEINNIE